MKTFTKLLLTAVCGFLLLSIRTLPVQAQDPTPSCAFNMADIACLEQHVKITYIGNVTSTDSVVWNFGGGIVLEGSGLGPYWVKWLTVGIKHVTLDIQENGMVCHADSTIHIVEGPTLFHMTGGGSYPAGGAGVPVGLSGSQNDVIYKLYRNGNYAGTAVGGTGQPISFGNQTEPGEYTCKGILEGTDCYRMMDGVAVVTIIGGPIYQHICMVSYDTTAHKNLIIWNKVDNGRVGHFNVYRETYQLNHYEKIAEVPYSQLSVYLDPDADPLVKADKYRLSVTDTTGEEYEKCPYHQTIHLNINPGIYGFNLILNHYIGFEFLTYKIHRKLGTGPYTVIDSVSSAVDSYTDVYTTSGLATYFIEVVRPEPCNPTKNSAYASVLSNTVTSAPLGLEEDELSGILIYPNPVHERLIVSIPGERQATFALEIYRPDGRKVYESQIPEGATSLNILDYQTGLYILKVKGSSAVFVTKFFKN